MGDVANVTGGKEGHKSVTRKVKVAEVGIGTENVSANLVDPLPSSTDPHPISETEVFDRAPLGSS